MAITVVMGGTPKWMLFAKDDPIKMDDLAVPELWELQEEFLLNYIKMNRATPI